MSSLIVVAFALVAGAAPTPEADRALDVLARCETVVGEGCLVATARLKLLGDAAAPAIARRIEALSPAGQLLALSALGDASTPEIVALHLRLAASRQADHKTRALAIEALARLHDKRLGRMAPTLMKDTAPLVRQATVRALGTLVTGGEKRLVKQLVAAGRDPAPAVRAEAMFGLGFCNCKEAGPLLVKSLSDPAGEVRHAAAEGLCFVRDPKAARALVPLLRASDELEARAAGRALRFQTDLDLGNDPAEWERELGRIEDNGVGGPNP